MTQSNTAWTTTTRKVGAYSRFYSVASLLLLVVLLASAGATGTSTQKTRRRPVREDDCPVASPGGQTLTIKFYGLFYFSFPNGKNQAEPSKRENATVGILSTRQDHTLYVTVGTSTYAFPHETLQNQPDVISIDRSEQHGDDVTIWGCCSDYRGWNQRDDRSDRNDHPHYFNWIIDFEGRKMHDGEDLKEEKDALKPKLIFKTGCFATSEVSSYKYYTVRNGDVREYGYVAAEMKAVIATQDGNEKILFTWGAVKKEIPKEISEIDLYNVRPEDLPHILELKRGKAIINMTKPQTDDLHIYYDDLLKGPKKEERFYFFPDLSSQRKRYLVSLPFICFAVGGSKVQ